jgi:hypothetical protein
VGLEWVWNERASREAAVFLVEVESALNRGVYIAPNGGRIRFGDYATSWLATRNNERATAAPRRVHHAAAPGGRSAG